MILKALYDYYERCKDNLPPMHNALVEFFYAIVIDENGTFKRLEPLDGMSLLIYRPEERTSAPIPHSMGDNGSYVLGLKGLKSDSDDKSILSELKKNEKNHTSFKNDVKNIFESLPNNRYARAVFLFYEKYNIEIIRQMKRDGNWADFCKSLNRNMTFRIDGDIVLAACDSQIIDYKISSAVNENNEAICLVTGAKEKPVSTTYSTFVRGSKSNAKLVSFQITSGYDSYGKEKGLNAPISEDAEFKYTTALLTLLSKNSRNKFVIGSRTFLFWSSADNVVGHKAEESLFDLFGFSDAEDDDPNAKIEQVRKVFKAIYSGELNTSLDDKFYILGLAPNAARIAVVYWAEIPLKEFAKRINRHFEDMEITGANKPYMALRSILGAVTLGGKASDATPNLPDALVKSIFQGIPYPYTLFAECIRRIRAEQSIYTTRAAIIKAYLNRLNNINEQNIKVMLDKNNTNPGYLCGRLFAVLDKIQEDANNQHTIRERYMNSASATPSAVFATILNLSSHHSEKLNEGRNVFFDQLKQEIIDKIDADGFPAHLDLQDQGRFFVGFYHQRQAFFTKNEKEENNNNQ